MKCLTLLLILFFLAACTGSTNESSGVAKVDTVPETIFKTDGAWADTIPPDGTYRFDIAFAEWEGKSMGEKVTVVINGDSIRIIYEGDGSLTNAKKGDVFDQGKIMKHKTGVWIIGKSKSDAEADEIGGCSGGPTVLDFKGRKYWMC
jgi:hypothetical protein